MLVIVFLLTMQFIYPNLSILYQSYPLQARVLRLIELEIFNRGRKIGVMWRNAFLDFLILFGID